MTPRRMLLLLLIQLCRMASVHAFASPKSAVIVRRDSIIRVDRNDNSTPKSSPSATQLRMVWKPKDPKGVAMDFPKTKTRFFATMLATLATWHGIAFNGMNPVLVSSAVTLVITMWSPGLGQAAFCGSFAGMTSAGTYASIGLVALLTALLFEVVVHRENKWLGLGGRLGIIAFVATNLVADGLGRPHDSLNVPMSLGHWRALIVNSNCRWQYCMGCAAIGSVATIVLREWADNSPRVDNDLRDPVRAAAVVGLLASLLVGMGIGKARLDNFGSLLIFGGAFTGMSLPSRLLTGVVPGENSYRSSNQPKRKAPGASSILLWYAVAGALGGLIHALTIPLDYWTGGIWGGKAGACAFGGVCLFRGLEKVVFTIRQSLGWIKTIDLNGSSANTAEE